jgi:Hydrogenase 4 membrane component (E)
MDSILTGNLIDVFAVMMLLLSLLAMATTRIGQLLTAFALQSVALAALAVTIAVSTGHNEMYIMAIITFAVKAMLIPWFMRRTVEKIKIGRNVDSALGVPGSLLLSAAMITAAYYITEPLMANIDTITRDCLAISLSIVFIGLFMMSTRRKALTQAIGLLMMENGLFLGVMSISYGMPLIIEMGIFFDVLMAVVIIGLFSFRISEAFDSSDTSLMRRLKD